MSCVKEISRTEFKMRGIASLLVVALIASTECSSGKKLAPNSVSNPKSVADLEEIISTMMTKIEDLAKENTQLKLDITQLKVNDEKMKSLVENTVENRLQYLEAVTRQITPPTCETLASLGVTRTGTYLVDPDGVLRGDPPIQVLCDMKTDPVSTIVLHDAMENTEIDHCPDPGCYSRGIAYHASMKQMQALIEQSESCEQKIRYDCFSTALTTSNTDYAWWVDRHEEPQYYWAGAHAGEHVCSCGLTENCIDPTLPCNCDAEAPEWESDEGAITNGTALPITELRFGGLQFDGQKANHTLGGLICQGKAASPDNPAESCSSLRKAGHTHAGYYLISTKEGRLDVVFCRMNLEDTDVDFQLDTGGRIVEESVYFNVYRTSMWNSTGVITFEGIEVNMGDAMSSSSRLAILV
ncbi:unnamed protein product [Darwinula stevensoni]|uniref:Uncharacterized protein n=1 Tax=Darwinula stevensoni TaxID=69355 RepID=A0A7R9A6M8_9CRUS|nr:unnamed protein product [Darwinula stevensoni]CAG0889760.1 unnamed protein product [Darwinula stevensoni]